MRFLVVAAAVMLMTGCSEPRIDTSSEAALRKSLVEVGASMPDGEREELDALMRRVVFDSSIASIGRKEAPSAQQALQQVSGMTGAEALKALREAEASKQAKRAADEAKAKAERAAKDADELATLEALEKAHADGLKKLAAIALENARAEKVTKHFRNDYLIRAVVRNGLDVALSSISFAYEVRSPDRAVPWDAGEGFFIIRGGIEPGETREVETVGGSEHILTHKALEEHPDARLAVRVIGAFDAAKVSVAPAGLEGWAAARLKALREATVSK